MWCAGVVESPAAVSRAAGRFRHHEHTQGVPRMTFKKTAARAVATSLVGMAGLGLGAGLAHADPFSPMPPPIPSPGVPTPGVPDLGANAGMPGNPIPAGHGYLPPPGHGGPMPQDRVPYTAVPAWVT